MNMIEVQGLRIDYDEVTAGDELSLKIESGQIYGFVGPNGAGKTSTIKALAGVLEPTYGEIRLAGFDLDTHRREALTPVGYMPDFPPVYEELKVWEYLDVFAAAYGVKEKERRNRVDHWLAKVSLESKREDFVKTLSRGMRQRLVLAKTLLPAPKILLLDEPASGLDPFSRRQVNDLLKEAAGQGAAILISSHILPDLSGLCDAVGILEKGRLVVSGTLAEIRERIGATRKLVIAFINEGEAQQRFWSVLGENGFDREKVAEDKGRYIIHFSGGESDAAALLARLGAAGIAVTEFSVRADDIEDIFFKIGAKEVA